MRSIRLSLEVRNRERGLLRLFQNVTEVQPVGPSAGSCNRSCNNIWVGNGHIWDSPTFEVEEHLGSSGTAERLVDQQLPNHRSFRRLALLAEQGFSEGSSRRGRFDATKIEFRKR